MNSQVNGRQSRKSSIGALVGYGTLRFLQFASAVIVMSLIAYAIHAYNFHGSKKTNFVLAVGVIGVFYNLVLFFLALIVPSLVLAGVYLISEIIMCLLWLCAFIVDAKVQGDHSCKIRRVSSYTPQYGSESDFLESGGEYNAFTHRYTTSSEKTACQSAKASIAFAGLAWLLFVLSTVFVGINIVRPILNHYGGKGLWKTGTSMDTRVDRASALTLTEPVGEKYAQDLENGAPVNPRHVETETRTEQYRAAEVDQRTVSTNNTNNSYAQEKSNVSAGAPVAH